MHLKRLPDKNESRQAWDDGVLAEASFRTTEFSLYCACAHLIAFALNHLLAPRFEPV